ncbi:MAG TPA: heavy-metal-associated domain-containing protein [Burkholderiaceae bacterium]|nr:heavy-metal-associated domain-containing protein [Burkholderiaceae bacterium]
MRHEFKVEDMTCGHCVAGVTKAVKGADPGAEVAIDLSAHSVKIDGAGKRSLYAQAIRTAGYTPVPAAA